MVINPTTRDNDQSLYLSDHVEAINNGNNHIKSIQPIELNNNNDNNNHDNNNNDNGKEMETITMITTSNLPVHPSTSTVNYYLYRNQNSMTEEEVKTLGEEEFENVRYELGEEEGYGEALEYNPEDEDEENKEDYEYGEEQSDDEGFF
jgi:hypothetical protein